MDNVESIGKRNVHSVLMMDLQPDTLYSLEVRSHNDTVLKRIGYKTVPGADATSIRIISGGDIGMNKQGKLMTSYIT